MQIQLEVKTKVLRSSVADSNLIKDSNFIKDSTRMLTGQVVMFAMATQERKNQRGK